MKFIFSACGFSAPALPEDPRPKNLVPQGHVPEALVVQCTQPVHPHLSIILS